MKIKLQEETVMRSVRTSVLWVWRKLTTFTAEAPWRTIRDNLLEIIRKLRCAGRVSIQIAAPVARSNTEAITIIGPRVLGSLGRGFLIMGHGD